MGKSAGKSDVFVVVVVVLLLTLFFSAHSLQCQDTVETYLTRRLGFNGKL